MEYLAKLLERPIPRALSREDPVSSAIIAKEFRARAEALRARKRAVLFGSPDAVEGVTKALAELLEDASLRAWLQLPALDDDALPQRRSLLSWARLVVPLLVLAGIAAYALLQDQPGLVTLVAVSAAAGVVDFLMPTLAPGVHTAAESGGWVPGLTSRFGRSA